MSKFFITKSTQVANMRPSLIKREEGNINVTCLTFTDLDVAISVLAMPSNLETNAIKIGRYTIMTSNSTYRYVENFSKDLLVLDIESFDALNLVQNSPIYRIGSGSRERFFVYNNGELFDLIKNVPSSTKIFDSNNNVKQGVRIYGGVIGGQIASPSQLRKRSITLACNNDAQAVAERWNKATFGALEMVLGTDVKPGKELVSTYSRLAQFKAPSTMQNCFVNSFAVYMGKWVDDSGNYYRDGSGVISSSFVAKAFESKDDRFSYSEDACRGAVLQCRPWTSKIMAQCVDQDYIRTMIKAKYYEIVHISRDNISEEIQKNFNLAFKGKGKFAGKVVVITNTMSDYEWDIDVYTDLNGLKCSFNLTTESGLNLLDIGNVVNYNNGAYLSTQMLTTIIHANHDKAFEFIVKRGELDTIKRFDNLFNQSVQIPNIKDVVVGYVEGVIPKIAPKFVMQHKKLFRSSVTNLLNGCVRDINNLHIAVDGIPAKILPDFTADFGDVVLGIDPDGYTEVYCPAAEKYFKEQNLPEEEWIVTGYKYPKIHYREFLLAKVISFKSIRKRIDSSNVHSSIKSALARQFKSLHKSVIVVPAIELLKNMLAGMDFDADAMTVVFDQEYNSLIVNSDVRPVAVVIDVKAPSDTNIQPVKFDLKTGWNIYCEMIASLNKSIGEVTIINDIFLELLCQVRNNNLTDAFVMFKYVFSGNNTQEKYVSPILNEVGECDIPVIRMTEEIMNLIDYRARTMKLTKDNMYACLYDLIAVMRMVQELTIDSAKTGLMVNMPFEMTVIKLKHRLGINLGFNWDKTETAPEGYKVSKEAGLFYKVDSDKSEWLDIGNSKRYFLLDTYQKIKTVLTRKLFKRLIGITDLVQEFTPEQKALFEQKSRAAGHNINRDIEFVKRIYGDMNGLHQVELAKKLSDEEILICKSEQKLIMKEVDNLVRRLTFKLAPEHRAMMLCRYTSDSNFSINICKEEFLHMVAENFAEINYAGERLLTCKYQDGDKVEFVAGLAPKAFCQASLTGEYTIKEFNNKFYATRLIKDLIAVPETDHSKIIFRVNSPDVQKINDLPDVLNGKYVNLYSFSGNALVVNKEIVAKFDCIPGGNISKLYANASGYVRKLVFGTITNKEGILKRGTLIAVLDKTVSSEVTESVKGELALMRKEAFQKICDKLAVKKQ